MFEHPLHKIINPASIIVAGASNSVMKMGALQSLNLLNSGYEGEIIFYHPRDKEVLGKPAFARIEDLPFVPDLALLITPCQVTPRVLDELGQAGVRHAVIITGGFREVSAEGAALESDLLDVAEKHGIRFVGPNCIGIINANNRMNLTMFPYHDRAGALSLVSQSGSYVTLTLPWLRDRGIRLSKSISVGNSANTDMVDWIDYLGEDPETRAIVLYIEGLRRGREFIETARRVSRKKPIVALYIGGTESGSRAGRSHTGSMGGPDLLYDGVFEQAGVIRASTVDELFSWGHTLANLEAPAGKRMAIVTQSGGPASSMADQIERCGLELPVLSDALQAELRQYMEPTASARNPIDLTFSLDHKSFSEVIPEILLKSGEIDGLFVHGLNGTGQVDEIYPSLKRVLDIPKEMITQQLRFDMTKILDLPRRYGKPMVASTFQFEDHASEAFIENDIPLLPTPEGAVKAMAALYKYSQIKHNLNGSAAQAEHGGRIVDKLPTAVDGIVNEFDAKKLLAAYGVPVSRERLTHSLAETKAAAAEIGYPVVLKGLPDAVAHKTEAGLVHLGIKDEVELEAAWKHIESSFPGCPRLVAEMLKGQRELLIGMTRFEGFGPAVMLGVGGIFTEAVKDVAFRVAPLTEKQAEDMIDSLKLKKLYGEFRGLPAVNRKALAAALIGIGRLALEHPEIAEIDINPLIICGDMPVAVDALIVTR